MNMNKYERLNQQKKYRSEKSFSGKKRVAAYCRVSTEKEEQAQSFESQCDFFRCYIEQKKEWEFYKVFADEGISGTSTKKREENKAISFDTLMYIHNNKTAALIECAMMIGAVLAGASEKEVSMIEQIANKVGIAFQIEDDILDVVSTSEEIGKPAGSDEKNGKNTYVLFKGIEQSKKDAEQYTREALQIFDELEYKNPFLRELLLYLVGRKN